MHPCLKGNLREGCAHAFSLLVLLVLPINLQGLHVLHDTLTCTLHVYKPTVQPVASSRLSFDVQVEALLLGEYSLFARANPYYPTTRLCSYFSTIFAAHLRVYTLRMGCKRSFSSFSYIPSFVYIHVQTRHIFSNKSVTTWTSKNRLRLDTDHTAG